EENPYYDLIKKWSDSPFQEVRISQGHIKGTKAKLANRKQIFAEISQWTEHYEPAQLFTGNDRRIEFQYAMHCATERRDNVQGIYMDEGTFTYVGREASSSFSDRVVDNWLKKMTYGFWWKNPASIGASDWITDAYAAFPELVHPLLARKQLHALQPAHYDNPTVKSFCSLLVEHFGADLHTLSELSTVLTLPHESIIARIDGYQNAMYSVVAGLLSDGKKIGVKYHPRNTDPDILQAEGRNGAYVIPHRIPFEAILPLLPPETTIIGDLSSTLINGRWLRPDARIISIKNPEAALAKEFELFFSRIGVTSVSATEVPQIASVSN
ncbi:MAG: alpha-2,8-polysialyltransferase family protein, partial [Pseudomonadales bacterium]|nr:alpha-2,8-polysialyltransferase family protein [Pseudomonadales bacterium]